MGFRMSIWALKLQRYKPSTCDRYPGEFAVRRRLVTGTTLRLELHHAVVRGVGRAAGCPVAAGRLRRNKGLIDVSGDEQRPRPGQRADRDRLFPSAEPLDLNQRLSEGGARLRRAVERPERRVHRPPEPAPEAA